MGLIFSGRPGWQPQGTMSINRGSRHAAGLLFAYVGSTGRAYMDVASQLQLEPGSATAVVQTPDGWAARSAASGSGLSVATTRIGEKFRGDLTILWRGVILGANSGDGSQFCGITVGAGGTSPFAFFEVCRPSSNANTLRVAVGSTGYSLADFSANLSGLYNLPVVIVASNRVGADLASALVLIPSGATFYSGAFNGGASTVPRSSSGGDRIQVGGRSEDSTRFTNIATTGAFIWSRAMSQDQMLDVARNTGSLFTPGLSATRFTSVGSGGEATPGGSSGYIPFKGPFGHPFNIRL